VIFSEVCPDLQKETIVMIRQKQSNKEATSCPIAPTCPRVPLPTSIAPPARFRRGEGRKAMLASSLSLPSDQRRPHIQRGAETLFGIVDSD
jgi:hypothetical protein